ncbi:MAG TPA: hypothetical protein VKZ63_11720 [Kofleriaceae bacterium]|nr:hypothetical protein [Kofleriaceae bacterium]
MSAACGGSADPQAAAEDLATELCDLSFRCCTRGEVNFYLGHYVGPEDCADRLVNSASLSSNLVINLSMFENVAVFLPNLRALDQAVKDGRTKVDSDAVDACVEFLRGVQCNALEEEAEVCTPPEIIEDHPCDPSVMFRGNVSEGGRCTSVGFSFECAEGLACRASSPLGVEGACVAPGELGDYCFTDGECGEDLYCSQLDGTCQEPGQPGEVCAYADPDDPSPSPDSLLLRCDTGLSCDPVTDTCVAPCERGAACAVDLDCDAEAGLVCMLGRCDSPRSEGLPCAQDEHCQEGLLCLPSIAEPGVLACTAPRGLDESCIYRQHAECASGYCDPATNRCAASSQPGDLCPTALHEQCDGGYCDSTFIACASDDTCTGSGVCNTSLGRCEYYCVPERPDGQSCANGFECASGSCISGICRTLPLADGQECLDASQCESGYCGYGVPRVCDTLPLPNGTACLSGIECESGICFNGECTPGLTEGAPCGDVASPPCALELYCDPEESPPVCVPVLDTGEVCKGHYQCRGQCVVAFGRTVCDDTPPAGGMVCDGAGGAE